MTVLKGKKHIEAKRDGKTYLPLVFFMMWTFVSIGRPQDIFLGLRPLRLAFISVALTVITYLAHTNSSQKKPLMSSAEVKLCFFFSAWIVATIAFGRNARMGFDFFTEYFIINILYFVMAICILRNVADVKKFIWVLIISAFGLASASLLTSHESRISIMGGANDPNDIAMLFVTCIPMMVYFTLLEKGLKRIFLFASIAICAYAVIFTFSRGGFLGLGLVSFLMLVQGYGFKKPAIKYFVAAAALIGLVTFAPDSFWDRIGTIRDEAQIDITDKTQQFSRLTIWSEGFAMFLEDPVAGVGFGAFPDALANHRLEAGGIPKYQTAHNSYILVLVETGAVGFAVYIALIIMTLAGFRRVWKYGKNDNLTGDAFIYAKMMETSMLGWLVCAFFLSKSYSSLFFIFPALSVTLQNILEGKTVEAVIPSRSQALRGSGRKKPGDVSNNPKPA